MSTRAVNYEDFANGGAARIRSGDKPGDTVEIILARARGQARADGFAEGVEQAEARIKRELEARLDVIINALNRAQEDREQAQKRASREASAILSTFLRAIAPKLAASTLPTEIIAALDAAFASAPDIHPIIEIGPDQADRVEAALVLRNANVEVLTDESLEDLEARIRWSGGFDLINTGAAIKRAIGVLDAHLAAHIAEPESGSQEQDQ